MLSNGRHLTDNYLQTMFINCKRKKLKYFIETPLKGAVTRGCPIAAVRVAIKVGNTMTSRGRHMPLSKGRRMSPLRYDRTDGN